MNVLKGILWLALAIFLIGCVGLGIYDRIDARYKPAPAPKAQPCPDCPDAEPDAQHHFGVEADRLRRTTLCAD